METEIGKYFGRKIFPPLDLTEYSNWMIWGHSTNVRTAKISKSMLAWGGDAESSEDIKREFLSINSRNIYDGGLL